MTTWKTYLTENATGYLEELMEFLRIPSISSLPEHAADVLRAADWVAERLKAAGIEEVQIMPTEGHPVVYGQWLHASDKPVIMIYGHFDTQPVDPLELWTRPPFDPVIRGDRIYAKKIAIPRSPDERPEDCRPAPRSGHRWILFPVGLCL